MRGILAPACRLMIAHRSARSECIIWSSWLDQDHAANPPSPTCQGPTRKVEGKGYGCVKWRKEGGEGSCQGWVKWAEWTPPKGKRAPKKKKPGR